MMNYREKLRLGVFIATLLAAVPINFGTFMIWHTVFNGYVKTDNGIILTSDERNTTVSCKC